MQDFQDTLYQENVPMASWVTALLGLVILGMAGTVLGIVLGGVSREDRAGIPVSMLATAVVAFFFWNFRSIDLRVTRQGFDARYGLFNHKVIPFAEVESCRPTTARFGRFFGIGVRLGVDGTWAYTTSFGPAVEVRRRSGKPFLVSSNRPEEICQVIDAELSRRAA